MLRADNVRFRYPEQRGDAWVLDGISLTVEQGDVICLAGRSGAGKSTLLRCMLGLVRPTEGDVTLDGTSLWAMSRGQQKALRQQVVWVMQDPAASLPPRMKVRDIVAEPLRIHRAPRDEIGERAVASLEAVQLPPSLHDRLPHMLSGGQQQRVAIARALIGGPRFILADEPSSALDAVTAMEIAKLLLDVATQQGAGLLVISHDATFAHHLGADVIELQEGRVAGRHNAAAWLASQRSTFEGHSA